LKVSTQWTSATQPVHQSVDVLSALTEPMTAVELANKLHYSDIHVRRALRRIEVTGAVRQTRRKRFGEHPVAVWSKA